MKGAKGCLQIGAGFRLSTVYTRMMICKHILNSYTHPHVPFRHMLRCYLVAASFMKLAALPMVISRGHSGALVSNMIFKIGEGLQSAGGHAILIMSVTMIVIRY